jgi:cytochrome c biogenesis protein CcdA
MGQLVLRLVLVFGGILALFALFSMAAQTDNKIVLYALGYGFPFWILLIIFGVLYRRSRNTEYRRTSSFRSR